ncbi:hypothetical protein Taro_053885 [Colocasia esculenta]|uniref:Uncharacterized protein n=1 Tax=Colocasia esculenta TaxID=4460 RepID=A0A843XNF1_COLES|nr:hypothetical protein [Colocasia esculenta]
MRKLNPSLRTKLLEVDPRTLEEALNAASRQESRVETYQVEKPECVHCGKRHGGDVCWLMSRRCLNCGSKDHWIKESPNLKELVLRDVPATSIMELATPTKEDENYILFPEMASTTPPQFPNHSWITPFVPGASPPFPRLTGQRGYHFQVTSGVIGVPVPEESVVKVDAAYEELLFVETF